MFFKKRKEEKDMATYEEVKAAYEKLSEEDKGKFKQSLETAAGEGEGEGVEQPPKAEAEKTGGEEEANTEAPDNGGGETPAEAAPQPADDKGECLGEAIEQIRAEIAALRAEITAARQEPTPASEDKQSMLDKISALYSD